LSAIVSTLLKLDFHVAIEFSAVNVRGKVTAGGFRMKSIRIGCIEIDRRILEEPWRGPRRDSNVSMSLSAHVLESTCGASE
jgi:hypothetical protein